MQVYALSHLSDAVLLRDLAALVMGDRITTARLLAHIAEVDARRLYVPAGYPSMHAYCVDELHLSEDAASKRIQAARAGRRFPALFAALAEGRLHLTAVCLLAPHLTPANADELMVEASYRRKTEIEALLARRFPMPDKPPSIRAISAHAPAHVGNASTSMFDVLSPGEEDPGTPATATVDEHAPAHVEYSRERRVPPVSGAGAPIPSERYIVQVTIAKSTHEKLRYAQALLSHAIPTGDVAQLLDRALDALIAQHEKRKLGAVSRRLRRSPHRTERSDAAARSRYIPALVRRAVWDRDGGQCTFVSAAGHRCAARRFLEFDHVDPVALGGQTTVEGMRLRCRAHNQYEAERYFGAEFMSRKRLEARPAPAEARTPAAAVEQSLGAAEAEGATRAAARENRGRPTGDARFQDDGMQLQPGSQELENESRLGVTETVSGLARPAPRATHPA